MRRERLQCARRAWVRPWVLPLAVALAMSLWAAISPSAVQAQPGGAANQARIQVEIKRVLKTMAEELVRIRKYLNYYDQINRIEVAQGRLSPAEADTRLKAKGQELYRKSFGEDDLRRLLDQHRDTLRAYFQRIEQAVNSSQRWPGDPSSYRALAKSTLERLRQDHEAWLTRRLDVLPVLTEAVRVLGWTMGYATPPASLNPFEGQRERVIAAIPSAKLQ